MYYTNNDGRLLVGSELKSFLAFPYFKKELNVEAVKPYLMNQYNDLNETFLKAFINFLLDTGLLIKMVSSIFINIGMQNMSKTV